MEFLFLAFQIMIFVVIPIMISKGKNKSTKSTFRLFGRLVIYGITIIMLIAMIFPVISQATGLETSETSVADGFTIDSYTVKLDVDQNQKVDVEEDITINFNEEGHHGIYKFTPEWLRYTSKEGKTIRRRSTVSDLRAEIPENKYGYDTFETSYLDTDYLNRYSESRYNDTYDYDVDEVNGKQRIKIGSSYITLNTGNKDYIIKYTYDMGSDPYSGYDEFIFHAYGDFWGTEIKNPSIEVNMPNNFDSKNVHFFMDKKRKYNITDAMDYSVSGNKLIAKFDKDKYNEFKLTHKNYPEILEKALTVDIELPEGYFNGGSYNYGFKSLSSIIVCLIVMVFSILLWFIFGKDYEKKAKVVSYLPPRDLSSAELGYIDSNNYSKKLAISLIVELAAKKMIKIRESKDGEIIIKGYKPSKKDKDYEKKLKEYDKKVNKLNEYEKIVIKELIKGSSEVHLKEHKTFYKVFSEIESKLDDEYRWVINEKISYVLKYLSLFLVNVCAILMLLAYRYFEDLSISLYNLYYVGFISVFVTFFFSIIMTRKSRYGEDITIEVSGFKDFLNLVEKDKLEELVEQMPDYFYQILPYTYVLNLSKKWIEKFEDIQMPEVDVNSINIDMIDRIVDDVYYPTPTYSSSGGSGCSSCGGGCSSCGGGCSSCGGGGSW